MATMLAYEDAYDYESSKVIPTATLKITVLLQPYINHIILFVLPASLSPLSLLPVSMPMCILPAFNFS